MCSEGDLKNSIFHLTKKIKTIIILVTEAAIFQSISIAFDHVEMHLKRKVWNCQNNVFLDARIFDEREKKFHEFQ